jgi:hypothetical protein
MIRRFRPAIKRLCFGQLTIRPEGLRLNKVAVDAPDLARRTGVLWQRRNRRIRLIDAFLRSMKPT